MKMNPQDDPRGKSGWGAGDSNKDDPTHKPATSSYESLAPAAFPSVPPPPPALPEPRIKGNHLLAATTLIAGALIIAGTVLVYGVRQAPRLRTAFETPPVAALRAPAAGAIAPETLASELQPFDLVVADQAVTSIEPQVEKCFAKEKRPIGVQVSVTVTPAGFVRDVVMREPSQATAEQRECVVRAYKSVRMASFSGEDVLFVKDYDLP